jgi:hypothetical protein
MVCQGGVFQEDPDRVGDKGERERERERERGREREMDRKRETYNMK